MSALVCPEAVASQHALLPVMGLNLVSGTSVLQRRPWQTMPAGVLAPIQLGRLPERLLVSVLIANYNYAAYIKDAIESVLHQTYPHVEVIVCDDGSTDDSCAVVETFVKRDPRVKLIRLEQNRGMAAALNAAYAASQGDIICLLDADDRYVPTKLERVVETLRARPKVGLLIHRMMMVDAEGLDIQVIPFMTEFERGWLADRLIRRGGRWRDMPGGALCMRREAAAFAFPIPEEHFRRAADGFVFTLLPLITEVDALEDVLYHYQIHGANDYARHGIDLAMARSQAEFIATQVTMVNQRLQELGIGGVRLDVEQHLVHRERRFVIDLLEGVPRRHLLRSYRRLAAALRADDLYRQSQKVLGLVVYGVAVMLWRPLRVHWLGLVLGPNRFKQRLLSIMNVVGRRSRGAAQ